MTDLAARLRAANPLASHDLGERELREIWRGLDLPVPAHARRRFAGRGLGVLAGGAATVAAAVLILSPPGTRTPAAQAFPILRTAGTDVHEEVLSAAGTPLAELPATDLQQALQTAHPFAMPAQPGFETNGYVLTSADGNTLCLLLSAAATDGHPTLIGGGCGDAAQVDMSGLITGLPYEVGDCSTCAQSDAQHEFAALVPPGATVTLTQGGSTTSVPVTDGIATGIATAPATLTITNASGVPLTQNYVVHTSGADTVPASGPATPGAASGATSASGATGATGATSAAGATGTGGGTGPIGAS